MTAKSEALKDMRKMGLDIRLLDRSVFLLPIDHVSLDQVVEISDYNPISSERVEYPKVIRSGSSSRLEMKLLLEELSRVDTLITKKRKSILKSKIHKVINQDKDKAQEIKATLESLDADLIELVDLKYAIKDQIRILKVLGE